LEKIKQIAEEINKAAAESAESQASLLVDFIFYKISTIETKIEYFNESRGGLYFESY
jgi:hypothetical protein